VFLNSFDFTHDRSNRHTKEQAEAADTPFRVKAGHASASPVKV
jgi:hypothetical protein